MKSFLKNKIGKADSILEFSSNSYKLSFFVAKAYFLTGEKSYFIVIKALS